MNENLPPFQGNEVAQQPVKLLVVFNHSSTHFDDGKFLLLAIHNSPI
jgi:hypothetical protein